MFTFSYTLDHGPSTHTLAACCGLWADTQSQAQINGWSSQYLTLIGRLSAVQRRAGGPRCAEEN